MTLSLLLCVVKVSHKLLINLPPSIHTLHPGGVVTVRVGSKVSNDKVVDDTDDDYVADDAVDDDDDLWHERNVGRGGRNGDIE